MIFERQRSETQNSFCMNVDKNKFYLFLRENSARGKSKLSELILHPKSYQCKKFCLTNSSWAETNIKHQKSTSFSIYTERVLLSPSIWIIGQGQYLDYRVPWKWALQVGHCAACHRSCPTSHESKAMGHTSHVTVWCRICRC